MVEDGSVVVSADPVDQAVVDRFLVERSGYVARGLWNRVAQVDAQLEALGVSPPGVDSSAESGSASPGSVEEAGGASARRRSGRRSG